MINRVSINLSENLLQIIRQVSCGAVHVVALSEDGLLQAWGICYSRSILLSYLNLKLFKHNFVIGLLEVNYRCIFAFAVQFNR